jgi:flagellar protein FlaG
MDTIRPISPPRDTDGQIKAVSAKERDVAVDARNDVAVSGNDVPAESRITQEIDPSTLKRAMDELSQHAQNINRDLIFTIDKELDKTVITVTDPLTEEVIRQIPSEEVLELARHVMDKDNGVLMHIKA